MESREIMRKVGRFVVSASLGSMAKENLKIRFRLVSGFAG